MKLNKQTVLNILAVARYAPSVHNIQPWKVQILNDGINVAIDSQHVLLDGDPTGRETTLSLGIFVEAILIAAKTLSLEVKTLDFKDKSVIIDFIHSGNVNKLDKYPALLKNRTSDRSIYEPVQIPVSLDLAIKESTAGFEGISMHIIRDRNIISKVADLTAKGISLALSSPGFRNELSNLLVLPWSKKNRGISVRSLYLPIWLSVLQPVLLKTGWFNSQEIKLEKKRWQSSSALVFITGKGDLSNYWFNVGRAYLRACLTIEEYGLAQSTSAAIVEASDFHEDIEAILETNERILALIRVGKGSDKRQHSPRLVPRDLITLS